MGSLAYGLVQRAQESPLKGLLRDSFLLVEKVGKLFQVCSPSCLLGGRKRKKFGRHLLKGYWVCRGGDACQEWAGIEANLENALFIHLTVSFWKAFYFIAFSLQVSALCASGQLEDHGVY